MQRSHSVRAWLLVITVLALAGCGGGGGGAGTPSVVITDPGVPSSGPRSAQVVDLANGSAAPGGFDAATFDPLTAVSGSTIPFRLVNAGSSAQGSPGGSLGRQGDEPHRAVSVASFYLSTCELTQAQWTALATRAGLSGADKLTPWLSAAPTTAVGNTATSANRAAFALSYDLVMEALTGYNAVVTSGQPRLRLPTAAEWEHACRAGSVGSYPWGNNDDSATVGAYAVVRETRTTIGVDTVAGIGGAARQANAFGFYDTCGNVWEWIDSGIGADATLRGGSWADNVLSARCANKQTMDRSIPDGAAGVRLVMVP